MPLIASSSSTVCGRTRANSSSTALVITMYAGTFCACAFRRATLAARASSASAGTAAQSRSAAAPRLSRRGRVRPSIFCRSASGSARRSVAAVAAAHHFGAARRQLHHRAERLDLGLLEQPGDQQRVDQLHDLRLLQVRRAGRTC